MRTIKGFVNINSLASNAPGTVATIGELSAIGRTFSTEIGEYISVSNPGYTFISISSKDSVLGKVAVNPIVYDVITSLVHSAILFSNVNIRPLVAVDFRSSITSTFFNQIQNLNFGPFVDNGSISVPTWISWDSLGEVGSTIKIWLNDAAFISEFDEYTIIVTSPTPTVDTFFLSNTAINNAIAAAPIETLLNTVNTNKLNSPETYLRIYKFNYIPPGVGMTPIVTLWPLLIYSKYGDNIDAVKDSITQYILANSTHTTAEWTAIFPDLFKRTEFIILPRWDKYAMPNLAVQTGMHSSISSPTESLVFTKAQIPTYTSAHIDANLESLPVVYKTLSMLVVGGPDNAFGVFKLSSVFSDYIPVGTGSLDFNRMVVNTKDWVTLIERVLIVAESATDITSLPADMRKVTRSGKLYIIALYNNIQYLVAAKINYGV